MPYKSNADLPKQVQSLPDHAKTIFRSAFNAAVKSVSEERAFKIAWAAVKRKYKKQGEEWIAKDAEDPYEYEETVVLDESSWRITGDGYLVAEPRVARTGIQIYSGYNYGVDKAELRIYRPDDTVFDKASMASFAYRPITYDHPDEMVDANNWKKLAVGNSGGEIARDGEFLRIPMVIMDGETIRRIKKDHRQLSVGYLADIDWTPGQTPSGEHYDAVQKNIRANHIAVVAHARGGPKLVLGDEEEMEDEDMPEVKTKTITLDGIDVTMDEMTASIVAREYTRITARLKDQDDTIVNLKKQVGDQQTEIVELKKVSGTKDGEIAVLKKSVEDSKVTPAMLDKHVADRLVVVSKARKILGEQFDIKDKTDLDIKRATVAVRLGDAAKTMSEDSINGAFEAIVASTTESRPSGVNSLASALSPSFDAGTMTPAEQAWEKRGQAQRDAWKNPPALPTH